MHDHHQLVHLVKLLDDESADTREKIAGVLAEYGLPLKTALAGVPAALMDPVRDQLEDIYENIQRDVLRKNWLDWMTAEDELSKLEDALGRIAGYLNGLGRTGSLPALLDELAEEFRRSGRPYEEFSLAQFLFDGGRFGGAQEDYDNPAHSNLVYVVQEGRGLPIALTALYMLTARRLGLNVEGCSYPRHFLARVRRGDKVILVDCFHRAQCWDVRTILAENPGRPEIRDALDRPAGAVSMVQRVLANLIGSFQRRDMKERHALMTDLFIQLQEATSFARQFAAAADRRPGQ